MADPCTDEFARAQVADLKATVTEHRRESQDAHARTATGLDKLALMAARAEERAEAETRARIEREAARDKLDAERNAQSWSPQKIAAVVGGVVAILGALGYGAPKAYDAAVGPAKADAPPPTSAPAEVHRPDIAP